MDINSSYPMAQEQNNRIDETVQKEGGRLSRFIRKRVRSDEDAEDVFQDVFSQLVEAYRGVERIEKVGAWLFRVARNKIADLYRKKTPMSESEWSSPETPLLADILPDLDNSPESMYMREIIWDAIEEALDELSEPQHEVFRLHELEGVSFRKISELTGETENTLRMRKYHAVQYLRERLAVLYHDLN